MPHRTVVVSPSSAPSITPGQLDRCSHLISQHTSSSLHTIRFHQSAPSVLPTASITSADHTERKQTASESIALRSGRLPAEANPAGALAGPGRVPCSSRSHTHTSFIISEENKGRLPALGMDGSHPESHEHTDLPRGGAAARRGRRTWSWLASWRVRATRTVRHFPSDPLDAGMCYPEHGARRWWAAESHGPRGGRGCGQSRR